LPAPRSNIALAHLLAYRAMTLEAITLREVLKKIPFVPNTERKPQELEG
jgi:hypothetical protein